VDEIHVLPLDARASILARKRGLRTPPADGLAA